jgi:signal transduction histidine kinase
MEMEKKELLDKTFQTVLEVGFGQGNMDLMSDIVASDVVGIGTTVDEKLFGLKDMQDLVKRQREQTVGMEVTYDVNTLDVHISADHNTATLTSEANLYLKVDTNRIEFYIRITAVFEYIQDKWLMVHWHASKPELVESEKDTWGIDSWKQKAEELEKLVAEKIADLVTKNRELEVEAALERVRALTMAMRNSEDVGRCVIKMFSELTALGVDEGTRFGIGILNHDNENNQLWTARKNGEEVNMHIGNIDMTLHPLLKSVRKAWKAQVPLHKYVLEGQDLLDYYQMLNNAPDYKIQITIEKLPKKEIQHCFIFEHGFFYAFSPREFQPELIHITQRFSALFEQTYRRYLDLVKAEAQAREAQIEASLEKVRSRSLAMHTSSELNEVVKVLFEKLTELQVPSTAVGIQTFIEGSNDMQAFVCGDVGTGIVINQYRLPYFDHPIVHDYINAHKNRLEVFVGNYSKKEKDSFYDVIVKLPELDNLAAEVRTMIYESDFYEVTIVPAERSLIAVNDFQGNPLTESQVNILKRFAKVFDQTYTRFLDLQKAEAQAREAQIEAALERVRAQAMAMHQTEDLGKTIMTYYEQLDSLIDSTIVRCGAGLLNKESTIADMSTASKSAEGETYYVKGTIDMKGHPLLDNTYDHWLKQKEYYHVLRGNEIKEYYQYITNQVAVPENKGNDELYFYFPMFTEGSFYVVTSKAVPEVELQIFRRFSSVLSLTYRRFNDLQKAEAQAREAKIEAALERVRSKSLAMHKSEELQEVVNTVYANLVELGVKMDSANFNILYEGSRDMDLWVANIYSQRIHIPYLDRKPMRDMMDAREKGINSLQVACTYEEKNLFWNEAFETTGFKSVATAERKKYILESKCWTILWTLAKHCGIQLNSYSRDSYTDEEVEILKRFTNVFDQAYVRFLDLQKAEEQAREAVKQSSLDRIRGEIASMRNTNDLERITPLIWKELTTLNIPFIRCGVFIMDEPLQQIHTFLSTPDGKAIAAFHLPYDAPGRTREILVNWMNKQVYIEHWDETAFSELGDLLVQQGAVPSKDVYLKTVPQGGVHLHCLPFIQGMLYVGNTIKLNEDEIHLIQSVAEAFSTAYARYEDFNKLEAAKQQVDKALVDLKQTQQQLVQSEKMASLGELTAGIAHEIQNPLNFVNNFSEVSTELVAEMNAELDKGNTDDAKEIANDLKQNLEKINHHGKRAADIVKGMLQHSRSSSGTKEPTDINALADEYLRLAYHGLRAKDKSFNATMKTDFDESIGNINIIPQDIGRVILNLITNAFYVVNEKSKMGITGFEPTVSVSTKKEGNKVLISVKDNGKGIPEHIKEKIFQPFFTTKPTGQGTGLGLSLSYDIVKAHGGELKVETKEGEGSEFIILLPT